MNVYCDGMFVVSLLQQQLLNYDWLMIWISYLGDPRYSLLLFFPFFFCFDKKLGFKILWASSATEWLNAVLKWCFRDDRPYWWSSDSCEVGDVKQFPITCETGPGFPSGHVMGSSSFIIVLLLHYQQKISNKNILHLYNLVFGTISFIFIILVAVSRIFIAAHFPHQVIFGAAGGVFAAFVLQKWFQYHSDTMLSSRALLVAFTSMLVSFLIFYILLLFNLNPNASIEKAVSHCYSSSWLHLNTTLFHSIMRSCGSIAGVGLFAVLLELYHGQEKKAEFFKSNTSWVMNVVSALAICNIVLHLESYKLPNYNEYIYYVLGFCKFFMLPLYVIVLKNLFEMISDMLRGRKCKLK